MRIIILGSNGQLGLCLKDQLSTTNHEVIFSSREHIDITNFEESKKMISDIDPDVIINASAYTAVDKAEDEKEDANLVNHLAPANLGNICLQLGCWLIHISTDYVFDGKSNTPYYEDSPTNPQGVYGETKLNGELAIEFSGCKHLIIRTAWLFSEYGNNFLKSMLRLSYERDELSIIDDQIGCPTYAQDLAKVISSIVDSHKPSSISGVYHYCGDSSCSWYDFAEAIFDEAKLIKMKTPNIIHAIKTYAYPTPASRPAFSVLDCTKIRDTFGANTSNWRAGINATLRALNK